MGAGRTIGEIYKHYCTWCDHNNKKIERKGDFTKKFKVLVPPRKTLQHGNTVYDVSVMSSGQVSRADPEILGQVNAEATRLMNDVEMLESELERAEYERDAADDQMDECMNTIETQSQTIDLLPNEVEALKKQIQQFHKQSADEKHYQKKVFPSMAKRAHQLAKKRFGKKRFLFILK